MRTRLAVELSFSILLLCILASCAGTNRAMVGYYQNHPEMRERLLEVRSLYIALVRGAGKPEDARAMREAIADELERKGRGRFLIVSSPRGADAVIETDMQEELGPASLDEPLPFPLEPPPLSPETVFARMRLTDPKTGRLIYKTDTKESPDLDVDTVEIAAYTVVKNLLQEIELARAALRP